MKKRCLKITFLVLTLCFTCPGQTTFQGITPGKSTRVDAERVFGKPVKQVSATLIEYAPRSFKLVQAKATVNGGKIYVQYREASQTAIVERVELILCAPYSGVTGPARDECNAKQAAMNREYDPGDTAGTLDAFRSVGIDDYRNGFKQTFYFGSPRYILKLNNMRTNDSGGFNETRWAFYSRELYGAAAPQGCMGTLRGEWETNRGRLTITRFNEYGGVRGTYTENNGTFTAERGDSTYVSGEWKDNTGSGTMYLYLRSLGDKEFKGTWERTSGRGQSKGTWEGRCIETTTGNQ